DLGWVMSIMLFPNDQGLREQYFAVQRVRMEVLDAKDGDLLQVDAQTLRFLLDAPRYEQLSNLTRLSTKRAIVAGDLLAALYLMDRFSVREPSINKAIHIAQRYAQGAKYSDGTELDSSERKIREHWQEFRPVAHLWAAQRLNEAYPFAPQKALF